MNRIAFGLIFFNLLLWNIVMPVFEPADESGHYAHTLYILRNKELPNLLDPSPQEKGVGYTTYSPLYYFSLIPLAKLVNAPLETEELLPYHPRKDLFKKSVFAVYLHSKDELVFKWNSLMSAVHLLRLQNSVYGLMTVYLVYLTGRQLFGNKSLKPLVAVSLVGFNPMFAHVSSSIVNVNLNILLFSLFFYLSVKSLANSAQVLKATSNKVNFLFGIIVGAAYLTKITGLTLILIWVVYLLISSRKLQQKLVLLIQSSLVFTIGFLTTAGWYLTRNLKLYGSLLETKTALRFFGRPVMQLQMSGPINYWTGFLQTTFKTLFSGYGMVTVHLPDWILFLLLVTLLLGLWGVLLFLKKARANKLHLFLLSSAGIIMLAHIRVNMTLEAFHARDLFVGTLPFSLLLVLGWEYLLRFPEQKWHGNNRLIKALMAVILFSVSIFHFNQSALVATAKMVQSGEWKLSELSHVGSFVLGFSALWVAVYLHGWKSVSTVWKISSPRKQQLLYYLIGGLFVSNLAIFTMLVIPRLYVL